jgi:hypothetical protein
MIMQRDYKQIIRNYDLTKKEATMLKDAEVLIEQMHDDLDGTDMEYLKDLKDIIDEAYDVIGCLNARLNVNITLDS